MKDCGGCRARTEIVQMGYDAIMLSLRSALRSDICCCCYKVSRWYLQMITGEYMPIAIPVYSEYQILAVRVKIARGFLSRRKLRDSESEKIRGNQANPNARDRYKRICKREYGPS